jgi:methylmalonyl-CoA mutase
VCSTLNKNENEIKRIQALVKDFSVREGRRPRMLLAKISQGGQDRGIKVVASAYADFGFDVDVAPLFRSPYEVARAAIQFDVHCIALSSLVGRHKEYLSLLNEELKRFGREDIIIFVAGKVNEEDFEYLLTHGATAIFGPGTVLTEAAVKILKSLERSVVL